MQMLAPLLIASDLKPPWLTAFGQTAILLHLGGEGGIQSKFEEQPRAK